MTDNEHPNQNSTNPKTRKESFLHYIGSVIRAMITVLAIAGLTSCGDLVNKPEESEQHPSHSEPKPEEKPQEPVKPETPEKPHKPEEKPSKKKEYDRMCEEERQWAYRAGLIDLNQLRLYQGRNLAPVFNTPGERQSGIDGWVICARALEINGFVPHSDYQD